MENIRIFKRGMLAVAIAMAFPAGGAWADEDVAELINPNVTEVQPKLLYLDKVNPLYRQYTGMNHQGVNGALDLNFIDRNEAGRWLRIEARDLGLETQEFKAAVEQQGDWAVKLGYDQIPRYAPFKVNSAVQGVGSNNVTLPATPFGVGSVSSVYDLKTERTATSIAASKFILEGLQANFSFKNEDKKGTRMWGSTGNSFSARDTGQAGSPFRTYSAQFFTPEPINSTHQQFEASLDYYSKKFQVSGGYYGSFYKNNAGNGLFVSPTSIFGRAPDTAAGATLTTLSTNLSPLSLPPDNHAQQFYVSGGYNWTDDTRGTFKASKTFAVQNDDFISASQIVPSSTSAACGPTQVCPATLTSRTNLGGKVETTNLAASLTSRLTKDLNVLASWAYEDRDDKTPIDRYAIDYSHGGAAITNNPQSMKTNRGKFEAGYRLPQNYKVTVGYDYDEREYVGAAEEGFRDKTKEGTFRIDLRKSLSETVNGNIQLAHADRTGSSWGSTPNAFGDHWVAPLQFSDRTRDKAKLMLDWAPLEALNIQFAYETTRDNYDSRKGNLGLDKGGTDLYSIDAAYRFTEDWKATLWYSLGFNNIKQNERQNPRLVDNVTAENLQDCTGAAHVNGTPPGTTYSSTTAASFTCNPWSANLKLKSEAVGAGVQGKVLGKVNVGAQYLYSRDVNKYNIAVGPVYAGSNANSPVLQGAGILPDTVYSLNTLRLFGSYPLAKATTVRLDYVYDVRKMDNYTWSGWRYSDGTTVFVKPEQTTQLIGLTLIQAF
ncbi:MAG: MtrB/PioB family decaheme-associated outer membrane protein [Actinomycetota bacterium]